jgi:hypothetical protein
MRSPTGNELIRGPESLVDKIDTLPTFDIEKIRTILRMSFAVLPQNLVSLFRDIMIEELPQNLLSRNPWYANLHNPTSDSGDYALVLEEVCDILSGVVDSNSNGYAPTEHVTVIEAHTLRVVRKKIFFAGAEPPSPYPLSVKYTILRYLILVKH